MSNAKHKEATNDTTITALGVVELQTMVNEAANKRQETVAKLQERRELITSELSTIEDLLTQMGEGTPERSPAPVKRGPKSASASTSTGRGTGTRGENADTIKGALEKLALKHKKGLSRADFTSKMITDMNYKTKSDPTAFANSVYTGGIYQMMKEGTLVPVGNRPHVVYKHKQNCTPNEIKAGAKV
jgi:hypothetical protein